jgi:hypothetical protein
MGNEWLGEIVANSSVKSYYEGHSMDQVTFPIRVFKQLGVDTVVCKSIPRALTRIPREKDTKNHNWQ